MATHSSILAWKLPWTEEPGRLQSMGSWRVRHDWATSLSLFTFMHGRRKWQPTPVFLPGKSHGWKSLVGYSPWGRKELDTTKWLTHTHKTIHGPIAYRIRAKCLSVTFKVCSDLKAMAPHSSIPAWKIPWTEEPGRPQSMGSLRVGHDWATSISLFTFMHWRRKWQPTPVFLPGESQGQGSLVGFCLWGRTESNTTEVT